MDRILDAGFKQPAGESVLIQSSSARVGDPAFTAAIRDVVARVSAVAAVENVRSPLAPGNAGQIAKDGRAVARRVRHPRRQGQGGRQDRPGPRQRRRAQRAHPGFFIGEFGDASAQKAVETAYGDDLGKAGTLSLPITLIILVLTFGALVAAGIPLLLGLTAVFATFGLVALPSHAAADGARGPAIVLLIGLAVGVDYSMFYLKRERQERAAGRSERAALEAAAATSGRSVLISGLTVIVGDGRHVPRPATRPSPRSALATILVVAVAVLGSLTVLPALLSRLGDNVDRLRVPFVGRLRRDDGEGRIWGAIVDRVLRRPALSAAARRRVAAGARGAGAAAAPRGSGGRVVPAVTRGHQDVQPDAEGVPGHGAARQRRRQGAERANAGDRTRRSRELERRALASGRAFEPITVDVNDDGTVANITVPIAGNGTDAASDAALPRLARDDRSRRRSAPFRTPRRASPG